MENDALTQWFRAHRPEGGWGASAQAWMDLRALVAQAWDEGAHAATLDYGIGEAVNPYR